MSSPIKGGKARLDQIKQQKSGKVPVSSATDTVKASGKKAAAKKPVKKK